MEYTIVVLTVFLGAILTFFSGFGLGTLMLPVFSLFFPLTTAISLTALVHFSNNIFKFGLVYKQIHWSTILKFGIPALVFAILGSFTLKGLNTNEYILSYVVNNKVFIITWLKLSIGVLMVFFALFELIPRWSKIEIHPKWLPIGGALSGFFGGLSGHQGAFRAAFLSKSSLTKEQFVASSNAIALIIDISRMIVYFQSFKWMVINQNKNLIILAVLAAFLGTFFGKKFLTKTTFQQIKKIVGICLILLGLSFVFGIL